MTKPRQGPVPYIISTEYDSGEGCEPSSVHAAREAHETAHGSSGSPARHRVRGRAPARTPL